MFSILLLTSNQREEQILKMAFEQLKIQTVVSKPNYATYIKATQYVPDVILLELPKMASDQLQFIRLAKRHKKVKKAAMLAYGNPVDGAIKKGFVQSGADCYLDRPLKFSALMSILRTRLKQMNKTLEGVDGQDKSSKEADLTEILDKGTLQNRKIELMVKHVSGLMAFPYAVTKVLHLAESEKSGAADLAKVIETDPVISTSILKVSNTVFFASSSRRITSIKDAIVRIGFRETKRIVMGMSVMNMFDTNESGLGFDRVAFWQHCLSTAIIAERMAMRMGNVETEEAFLSGLLHDFGIILLDEFFPTIFSQALEKTTDSGSHFVDEEIRLLGVSHLDLVEELFNAWKLPNPIIEATRDYGDMYEGEQIVDTSPKKIALCTAVANSLAKALCYGAGCDQFTYHLGDWAFRTVKLPTGPTSSFYEDIGKEVDFYRKFLSIEDQDKAAPEDPSTKKQVGVLNLAGDIYVPPEVYLNAQGHEVQRLEQSESYTNLDSQLDAVVVWAGEETTADLIQPLRNVLQRQAERAEEPEGPTSDPPFLPVVAFIPDGSPLGKNGIAKEASLVVRNLDIRHIDAILETSCGGKIVNMADKTHEPRPSSEPAPPPDMSAPLLEEGTVENTESETTQDAA